MTAHQGRILGEPPEPKPEPRDLVAELDAALLAVGITPRSIDAPYMEAIEPDIDDHVSASEDRRRQRIADEWNERLFGRSA